jgi:hypothetical protein
VSAGSSLVRGVGGLCDFPAPSAAVVVPAVAWSGVAGAIVPADYGSSAERTAALPLFLERYNLRRPHGSLGHKRPASRLRDLAGNYS